MRPFQPPFLILLVAAMTPDVALACSCVGAPLDERYAASGNVFTATVTGSREDGPIYVNYSFTVTEVFKGDVPFQYLRAHPLGAICGTTLQVQKEYLFFANDDGAVGLCSGHGQVDEDARHSRKPWLDLLRRHKADASASLAAPWEYAEDDGYCWLTAIVKAPAIKRRFAARFAYRRASAPAHARLEIDWPARSVSEARNLRVQTRERRYKAKWRETGPGKRGHYVLDGPKVAQLLHELAQRPTAKVRGKLAELGTIDAHLDAANSGADIRRFLACMER